MDHGTRKIGQPAEEFARDHIAVRPELSSGTAFPFDLWQEMGNSGLLGISIRKEFGGQGRGYPEIVAAGRALTRHGGCLGIVLSWLMHQITARFFLQGFGSIEQKNQHLPGMASGRLTACIAISEPGRGGHPKHIATTAEQGGSSVRISGEKTYLTNGPIAGVYLVLAVSGMEGERKRFSTYIVPRGTSGLIVSDPLDFGFLRPCPHGGITLEDCLVPAGSLLGPEGSAYELMVLPFREVEDVMMTGPLLGAQEARLAETVRSLGAAAADDVALKLGGIQASLTALDLISRECSARLENEGISADLAPLILAFRNLFRQVHADLTGIIASSGIGMSDVCRTLAADLDQVVKFAGRVSALRQMKIGRGLFKRS
jgi:acyl-CoA dehydrogenase